MDYYNGKKLAYFYIRNVQVDACVMINDAREGNHLVVAVNDTRESKSGNVVVKDADCGETLFSSPFIIPDNCKIMIGSVPERSQQAMWLIVHTIGKDKFTNHYMSGRLPLNWKIPSDGLIS